MPKALQNIRVIDCSTVIAAPFAAGLLADFGAEVIKVEMPGKGDPLRTLGPYYNGEGTRWATFGRNKKCITLDLHFEEGKELFLELVKKSDVLIENFRTGTLDKWGLDIDTLKKANPRIIVIRVTGYGQTGPYKDKVGFGTPATAFSGMTYISGYKDRPPVSPPFSLADYIAGLYAALSAMISLYYRDVNGGGGQQADVSLYEGIFRMMEILLADYQFNGVVRGRAPSLNGTSSPGGTFETKDGKWVVLICSTDGTFEHLTKAMERPELMEKYANNADRLKEDVYMNSLVSDWIQGLDYELLAEKADKYGVPVSLIFSIEDIMNNEQYKFRNNILKIPDEQLGEVMMPGIVPVLSETPGEVKWSGPAIGAHNSEIFSSLLQVDEERLAYLKERNII